MSATPAPTLSLGIPTFRRLRWLRDNLAGILGQVGQLPAGTVEIVVSENCGDDGTWEHLQEVAAQHPSLKVHRNERNVGAEANIHGLPALCAGEYLWLIGDDDFPTPDALREILAIISTHQPDYLVLNFIASDESMQRRGEPALPLHEDHELKGREEGLEAVPHLTMGFLSAWVGRRQFFNQLDRDAYLEFARWGLSIMVDRYMGVSNLRRGYAVARPMLITRKPAIEEYPATFDYFAWFFEGSAAVFTYLLRNGFITAQAIDERKGQLLRHSAVKRILFERAVGTFDTRRVNAMLFRHYRRRWEYWSLCVPAMFTPGLGPLALRLSRIHARRGKARA